MACVVLALLLSTAPQPGPSAFRHVAEQVQPSLLALRCTSGAPATGVIAGINGEVLTSAASCVGHEFFAQLGDKAVVLTRVKQSDALGVALLRLPPGTYAAAPVAKAALASESWIVAVGATRKGPSPAAGMLHDDPSSAAHQLIDAPALPGAGVFSLDGKLVGVAVQPAPRHQMRMAPIAAIHAWLTGGAP